DGCIHKAAGSCLYDECNSLNGCETSKAKITCGYDLPAKCEYQFINICVFVCSVKCCTNALHEYSLIKTAAIEGCVT
ncbi:hypothetical protein KUCAC02_024240, partial [Chaenocephalus aceratus]